MRFLLYAILAASASIASPALALGFLDLQDRQCSALNVETVADARYAASVGVMSQDPAVRAQLLSGMGEGATTCAAAMAKTLCSRETFNYTIESITAVFPANSAFMNTLAAAEAMQNPRENGLAITGAVTGATVGGIAGMLLGGDKPLSGALNGALKTGAVLMTLGAWYDTRAALDACADQQRAFTELTAAMMRGGLRRVPSDGDMRAVVLQAASGGSAGQQQTAKAMTEAMLITADRIENAHDNY